MKFFAFMIAVAIVIGYIDNLEKKITSLKSELYKLKNKSNDDDYID